MKKQNNRPDSPYKNRVQRGSSQQRGKPSSVNGKADDGLTNLITGCIIKSGNYGYAVFSHCDV